MSFDSITNRGEFFSDHYLGAVIAGDLGDLRRRWDDEEAAHKETARSRLRGLGARFFAARADVTEADGDARVEASRALNTLVVEALGFTVERRVVELSHATTDTLEAPVISTVDTGSGLLLVAIEVGMADDVADLFDSEYDAQVRLLDPMSRLSDKQQIRCATDAIAELFATDEPPRWVLAVAGRLVLLADRLKWSEGRFLAVDLDTALERADTRKGGELETIGGLFSADALVSDEGQSVMDELDDKAQKHAVGVSKDLRDGIRHSIEILANEVVAQRLQQTREQHRTRFAGDEVDARELTKQCLRYLYRLLVLLYAESRRELGIVPVDDEVYVGGYSLDRLRELVLVDLDTDDAREGHHFDDSLRALFDLVNDGYNAENIIQRLTFETHAIESESSYEEYLQFPGLDAALFDHASTELLDGVTLRNEALQSVLRLLMLSPEGKGRDRGFISYAQLGINQLGAVYEGLMAYTGFFAAEDLYEVAKDGNPTDGTWVLPVDRATDYPDEVFVKRTDPLTGASERIMHPRGSFVFRLSGRDRQRSASYYTPEVLTRCVVKHALAELLGMDDYAPENGSSGIIEARQILDLTICEPALGSGAFLNEAINQLSAEYLRRRQAELGETLDPETYLRELQKVKAHFALHQSYGVDLNATAVELAEVSLWLNCMHPGLKAPWFGLQLRRGNSLIGCRRATWRADQLSMRPWAQTGSEKLVPPTDRPLSDSLDDDEIHHFLLPGHGWAAVADRAEAKQLRPDRAKGLRDWRKVMLAQPSRTDALRLEALSQGVERLWSQAAARIRLTQTALRRSLGVWGGEEQFVRTGVSRSVAEDAISDPDSPLGRLRVVMDAWIGLWFWPIDSDVVLPSWSQWLSAIEELIDPGASVPSSGQLDFDDLTALVEAELDVGQRATVAETRARYEWLGRAVDLARAEGAWHWSLEFAPAFAAGGFDLQVGNPPWVRMFWDHEATMSEVEPRIGLGLAQEASDFVPDYYVSSYLRELASTGSLIACLGSPLLFPELAGQQSNLYLNFIRVFREHKAESGIAGALHQDTHMGDPDAGGFRRSIHRTLRRRFHFRNERHVFPDVKNNTSFSLNIYGRPQPPCYQQIAWLLEAETAAASFTHDGTGPVPGLKFENGDWDLRPHRARIVTVDESVLKSWALLLDGPGCPALEARALLPVTTDDGAAIAILGSHTRRLADATYEWERGFEAGKAVSAGILLELSGRPSEVADLVLLAGHIGVASPFTQEPHVPFRSNRDYIGLDPLAMAPDFLPASTYAIASRDLAEAAAKLWSGRPSTSYWRVGWRRRMDPTGERSLQAALYPPGPVHVHGAHTLRMPTNRDTVTLAGLWSSIAYEYFLRLLGKENFQDEMLRAMPWPNVADSVAGALALRTLRLNCVTSNYSSLWAELAQEQWRSDSWTQPGASADLGDVPDNWVPTVPLRHERDRRLALVELDALSALTLGLAAQQLCAMYRTQFPVLRKYEYAMAFDSEGRKICAHHQSAGYRQAQVQQEAKDGTRPSEWTNIWKLVEQWEDDPSSVEWDGQFHPPFYRPNREQEMTHAYHEFERRYPELHDR